VVLALMVSFVVAGVQALVVLLVRRDRRHFFAFGPALGAGALLTVVFEASIRSYLGG
jgi:prepilin signal peptidase PulO-like enzyme (type II secretory pathway)